MLGSCFTEGLANTPGTQGPNAGATETAEILAFSGSLSRAGCLSQVAEGLRSKRGGKYNYGQVTCTCNVVNDVDLKGPGGYWYFGGTRLAQPSWPLSSSTLPYTLPFPPWSTSLPHPICTTSSVLWPGAGEAGRGWARCPVFQFTVPVCWHLLIFQRPVTSRENRCCHPGENHQPKAAGRPQVSDLLLRGRSPP